MYPKILITGSNHLLKLANQFLETFDVPNWIEIKTSSYLMETLHSVTKPKKFTSSIRTSNHYY